MMSERLDKVKLVKGTKWERQDSLDNIGVPTLELVKDAIKEGKKDLARDLAEYYYWWEIKWVRDANIDLVNGLSSYYMANYGEESLYAAYRELNQRNRVAPLPPPASKPTKPKDTPFERGMHHAPEMARNNRMGREDGTGGFTVEEYEDRYEVVWDPCYSGGRPRRADPYSSTPSRSAPPFSYPVNQCAHPWTAGKTGLSGWCIHCFVGHEHTEIETSGGYLSQWVVGYPDNPWGPGCRYVAYKDVDYIPEKYYTAHQMVKPPVTVPIPKFKDVIKPIKVTHSDDLPVKYQNTMRRLRKAWADGTSEEQIKLVDTLAAEARIHHIRSVCRSVWGWIDMIAEKYGYEDVYHILRSIYSWYEPLPLPSETKLTKATLPPVEERVRKAATWCRSDRCGPGFEGSVKVTEEPDRFVLQLGPCGSGGRATAPEPPMDEFTASVLKELDMPDPSRPGFPDMKFGVTSQAHPVAWNKVGIPHFCLRCCVQIERAAVASHGYLTTIVDRPENHTDPNCTWYVYKDVDKIPEQYYTRIGAKKPAVQ